MDLKHGKRTNSNHHPRKSTDSFASKGVGMKSKVKSVTESPPVQIMEKSPPGFDPNRIPHSIFVNKPPGGTTDWSVASNESLFSIRIGNTSFSRYNVVSVPKEKTSEDVLELGESVSGPPPIEVGDRESTEEYESVKSRITQSEEVTEDITIREVIPAGLEYDHSNAESPNQERDFKVHANANRARMKQEITPKNKRSSECCCSGCTCEFCCSVKMRCCFCKWPSCDCCERSKCNNCCKWPSCKSCHCGNCFKWPNYDDCCSFKCCKWPRCDNCCSFKCCKWPRCDNCCSFNCCKWPKCDNCCSFKCCKWPRCDNCCSCKCCKWPSCDNCCTFKCCKWPRCDSCCSFKCCKWPSCDNCCKWPSCKCGGCCEWSGCKCFSNCSCTNCCKLPSCDWPTGCCKLPSCSGYSCGWSCKWRNIFCCLPKKPRHPNRGPSRGSRQPCHWFSSILCCSNC